MTSRPRDPRFYVVGGPVQPGRDCYLQRSADAELLQRLTDAEYCHVLAQRQTGKTSLIAMTAWNLRRNDRLVALVDLTQASEEDPSENAGRWYYSIAYRIARDLRIKADIQAWWAQRGGLTNLQRLREFFHEIVLQNTSKPVVIVFDRIEATLGEPLAQDLFTAIRACFDSRATDVNFQRLTFALVGSGSPDEFVKSIQGSPFEVSCPIRLPDFSPQELGGLAAGLGDPLANADEVCRRVWSWTRGQPYLSQKVFRGLARRKDADLSADAVDELVRSQFLGVHTLSEEPHLSAIAAQMLRDSGNRTARLNLYGRIRKGVEVMRDTASGVQKELLTAGLVAVGQDDELRVRNEIYAMVFGTRWVNQSLPFGVKGLGIAAAICAFVLAAPIWYTEYLPRPYVRALSPPDQELQVAEDAYQSLRMLPGYASTADRLFISYLARAAKDADTVTDMERLNERLRLLPEGQRLSQEMLAGYWEQRARRAAEAGDRDTALVSLLEALQVPTDYRRRWAAELTGNDYEYLLATWRTRADLRSLRTDEEAGRVTLLDAANNVQIWNIAEPQPALLRDFRISAEERLELIERRQVQAGFGVPVLYIQSDHQRPEQVSIMLRAPSGESARFNLADGQQGNGEFRFALGDRPELGALAQGELSGNWSLSLTDDEYGSAGQLLAWGIGFGGAYDLPENYVVQPIPEPRPTERANSRLGANGRMALAWPARRDTQGPILVWDLQAENILTRIPRDAATQGVRFALNGERVITLGALSLSVWDTQSGEQVGEIPLSSSELPPLSVNGRFAVINTLRPDQTRGVIVWDLKSMQRIGQLIAADDAMAVTVDSSGTYLAIGGADPFLRVWSLASGTLVKEFEHSSPVRMVKFDMDGEWLATDDMSSTFRLWDMRDATAPLLERFGISPWYADFAADSSSLLFGSSERVFEVARLPSGIDTGQSLRHALIGDSSVGPQIMAGRNLAVTSDAQKGVKLWRLARPDVLSAAGVREFPNGTRLVLSRDGQRVAVGTSFGDISIHAPGAPGGINLADVNGAEANTSEVIGLEFSAQREWLASASLDGRVRIWDANSGALLDARVVHPDGGPHDLEFVDDGQRLISVSRREAIVTELATGEVLGRLRIQANHPQLAVARDTGEVFIADDLNGVTWWNWQTGESERIVSGDYQIRSVAVTGDGLRMVTASDARELILWDVSQREPLQVRAQVAGKVDDMWITAGNNLLVQAGYWLQSVSITPTGLNIRHTRLLPDVPASVRPGMAANRAYVLSPGANTPLVADIRVDEPSGQGVQGDPQELRQLWQDRLALMPADSGTAVPRSAPTTDNLRSELTDEQR